MPQTKIINAKGKEAGSVELADSLFGAPVNEALIHQAVVATAGAGSPGYGRHADARHGRRRRPQAVAPEGHRPRAAGEPNVRRIGAAAAWSSGRTRATTT